MIKFLVCVLYRCQVGLHSWTWDGTHDKRLKCPDCGAVKP